MYTDRFLGVESKNINMPLIFLKIRLYCFMSVLFYAIVKNFTVKHRHWSDKVV